MSYVVQSEDESRNRLAPPSTLQKETKQSQPTNRRYNDKHSERKLLHRDLRPIANRGAKLLQLRHMRRDSDPGAPSFIDLLQTKSDKNAVCDSIVHSLPGPRMQGIGGQT